jgi:WD40 repeat protein
MTNAGTERDPIDQLAEEFAARLRKGERPALTEYVQRHPELADEIRELFPALVMMEQLKPTENESSSTAHVKGVGKLEQIGDYRILREIGRGGMGVVYEAEQVSLGRHVALKVLLSAGLGNNTYLERFRREAKAAARLHHTNIVPVFGVGEEAGVHYYAMQFIHGEGLDRVLEDVQRMRVDKNASAPGPKTDTSGALARSLVMGRFEQGAGGRAQGLEVRSQKSELGSLEVASSADPCPPTPDGSSIVIRPSPIAPDPTAQTSPTVTLSGKHSEWEYCRTVARIALQVAEGLAYAHKQGILHRDIKPSNLLLDLQGTVWITDFGLAKAEGTNELTQTGDIVGTLRYMAPERFEGTSMPQSDIFGLGMTLYEMLTLRPAFDEPNRARLMQRLLHEDPPRPRKLEPRIPRDLETIVLKCIAREPRYRYLRAEDLAEDLSRFLSDRPVLARQTPWREHVWRWVRRNPGWAATLSTVFLLLVVMAVGGVFLNLHLRDLNSTLGQAVTSARDAELEKTEKLWQAQLERARAARSSGRLGQRFEALKAIREAKEIRATSELRDEAVAALALPDVEVAREWQGWPEGTIDLAFDADFERYARINKDGEITVCRLTDAGEEVLARLPAHGRAPFHLLMMSPDGRFLVYGHTCTGESLAHGLRVWKLDAPEPTVLLDEPAGKYGWAVTFHTKHPWLAVGHADATASIYDLATGHRLKRLKLGSPPMNLAFHPTSGLLAVACGNVVRVVDTDSGRELPALHHPEKVEQILGMAWHPDGRILATGCMPDYRIRFWDTETGNMIMATPESQPAAIVHLAFNHSGDHLVSGPFSGPGQIWSANNARRILVLESTTNPLQFSRDDSLLGYQHTGSRVALWRAATGHELRLLRRRNAEPGEYPYAALFHSDGRTLAVASESRLSFFDAQNDSESVSVRLAEEFSSWPRAFDRSGSWLTSGRAGLLSWPAKMELTRSDVLTIGPPRRLSPTRGNSGIGLGHRTVAIPERTYARILDRDRPGWHVDVGPLYDARMCAVSPDGCWVATCDWWWDGRSPGIRLWEAKTGRHVKDFATEAYSIAAFSPDGRWLATSSRNVPCTLWEVGSWQPGRRFAGYGLVFNADGKLLALPGENGSIRVIETTSGREVFRLTGPEPTSYGPQCFSSDGSYLVATCSSSDALYVWDLRLIRSELKEMGLDWEWPEFPPPVPGLERHRQIIEVDPGFLHVPVLKDDRHAVAVFSLCIALQPLNPEAHLQRGLAYAHLKQWRDAIADYDRFLSLTPPAHPRRIEVVCRRATDYQNLNNLAGTASALQEILPMKSEQLPWPDQVASLCDQVAWHYVRAPQHESGPQNLLALAKKAVEIEPFNDAYQNTLGATYYRLGQWQEAVHCLEQNLRSRPKDAAWDLYFVAMSYQQLGQPARARQCFKEASAFSEAHSNPTSEQARELEALRSEASGVLGIVGARVQD